MYLLPRRKIPRPFKDPNSVPTKHLIKRNDGSISAYTLHRAYYRFKVKDDPTPWIYFEPLREPNLPILGEGSLGFDLPPGTSYQQCMEVADFLNEHIRCVRATMFVRAKVLPMKKLILALLAICALIGILLIWWFAMPHAVSVPK